MSPSHFWRWSLPLLLNDVILSPTTIFCEKRVSVLSSCPFLSPFLPFHHTLLTLMGSCFYLSVLVCSVFSSLSTRDQFMKNTVYIIYIHIPLNTVSYNVFCFRGIFAFGNKHFTRHVCFWKHSGPGQISGLISVMYTYAELTTPHPACTPS